MATQTLWRVVGGARLVRERYELGSKELTGSLEPDAVVEEIELRGSRLHYRLVAGSGPETGWVTVHAKVGELLQRFTPLVYIMTMGTRGDLQPFVALALALKDAGVRVKLFGPPEYGHFPAVQELLGGFEVIGSGWSTTKAAAEDPVPKETSGDASGKGPQIQGSSDTAGIRESDDEATTSAGTESEGGAMSTPSETASPPSESEAGADESHHQDARRWAQVSPAFLGLLAKMGVDKWNAGDVVHVQWILSQMPRMVSSLMKAVEEEKPDVLVYNHLAVNLGQLAWRRYGIRSIFANLGMECQLATKKQDVFNYFTLKEVDELKVRPLAGVAPIAEMSEKEFNSLYTSPDRLLGTSRIITYVLSDHDKKLAKEWDFCGFWTYDKELQFQEASAAGGGEALQKLEEFLQSGSPPVCVGWGSMPATGRQLAVCLSAVRKLGLRAVFLQGWSSCSLKTLEAVCLAMPKKFQGLMDFARSDDVFYINEAPHDWLFPRCLCAIHHGGAGTTAAALRSGIPSIVCPLGYDQPFHGRLVEILSAGICVGKVMRLTVAEIEEALQRICNEETLKHGAARAAETLRSEPGVSRAVERIKQVMLEEVWSGQTAQNWLAFREAKQAAKSVRQGHQKFHQPGGR